VVRAGEPVVNSTVRLPIPQTTTRAARCGIGEPHIAVSVGPPFRATRTARNRHIVARATTASARNRAVGE
jgi:hypothetical protein